MDSVFKSSCTGSYSNSCDKVTQIRGFIGLCVQYRQLRMMMLHVGLGVRFGRCSLRNERQRRRVTLHSVKVVEMVEVRGGSTGANVPGNVMRIGEIEAEPPTTLDSAQAEKRRDSL